MHAKLLVALCLTLAPLAARAQAINTALCDFHGTTSPYDATYAAFETSLVGPHGNTGLSIQNQVERHQVGGVSVVIIEDRQIVQHHWYGCQNRKLGIKSNSLTMYQAASLSKAITAMGLVKADRLGDVDLDESVTSLVAAHPGSLLWEWRLWKFLNAPSNPDSITLRRLLNHSAGLDTHGIDAWATGNVPTMREILLGASGWNGMFDGGVEPIFTPGTDASYSGGGFIVAEHILELEQSLTFKDYLQQKILDDAGLTHATFDKASLAMPWLARGCSRLSCTYDLLQTNVKAAGGLLIAAREYADLVVAYANGGVTASGERILMQADLDWILTPATHERSSKTPCVSPGATQVNPATGAEETCVAGKWRELLLDDGTVYGLGVELSDDIRTDGYHERVRHGGAQTGSRTYFQIHRITGDGVVIMVNGVESWTDSDGFEYGADPLLDEIKEAYWDAY